MKLSIIIVNWNSKDYVQACLASIYREKTDFSWEVVVVDNASHDGCDAMLRQEFPNTVFVQSGSNSGFARANNLGVKNATGDVLLFLNPDTEVLPGALGTMVEQLSAIPGAGAVGCRILNADRTVQTSCIQSYPTIVNQLLNSEALRRLTPRSPLWGMAPLFGSDARSAQVEAISGACLMVRRVAFEKVGGFSEDYFMYAEDIDLGYKMNRAGTPCWYVPGASIIHFGGGSSQQAKGGFSTVMMGESIYRFLRKHRGPAYAAAYRLAVAFNALCRFLLLVLLSPVRWAQGRGRSIRNSFQKWLSLLRWSAGMEGWVRNYDSKAKDRA